MEDFFSKSIVKANASPPPGLGPWHRLGGGVCAPPGQCPPPARPPSQSVPGAQPRRQARVCVKKQPSQDVLHGDEAEEELGLARLVSSYTLPHQNSQPGERGRQTARSKVLSRRARDT